jgi:hypothetical protein
MGTYTTPTKYAAAFARRQDLVGKKITEVIAAMAKEGGNDLRDATTGTLQEKDLRRMGHPYARRSRSAMQLSAAKRGANLGLRDSGRRQVSRSGAVNPFPTNKWTGGTQRAIFVRKAGKNSYDVGSGSPHAKFLFAPRGTKYMKPRGVMGERRKHGQDGILRIRHRARSQGYLQVVRRANRKSVP